jgi:hypothetical protein
MFSAVSSTSATGSRLGFDDCDIRRAGSVYLAAQAMIVMGRLPPLAPSLQADVGADTRRADVRKVRDGWIADGSARLHSGEMHLRNVLLALTCCLMAGCNVVATTTPLIRTAGDASPTLKPGAWSYTKACKDDRADQLCGRPVPLFRATGGDLRPIISPGLPNADAEALDHPSPYVIGSNDPLLLQVKVMDPTGSGPPVQFMYVALEPTAYDGEHRIAAAKAWPVLCGPPPKEGDPNYGLMDEQGQVTNQPFPGLRVDGFNCSPEDFPAIQRAAKASRSLIGEHDLYLVEWKPG